MRKACTRADFSRIILVNDGKTKVSKLNSVNKIDHRIASSAQFIRTRRSTGRPKAPQVIAYSAAAWPRKRARPLQRIEIHIRNAIDDCSLARFAAVFFNGFT